MTPIAMRSNHAEITLSAMEKNSKNCEKSEADYVAGVQRQLYEEGTKETAEKKVIYFFFKVFLLVVFSGIVAFCSRTL